MKQQVINNNPSQINRYIYIYRYIVMQRQPIDNIIINDKEQQQTNNNKTQSQTMKFNTFGQLFHTIKSDTEFNNDIKLKRLKKELDILSTYQNPTTTIDQLQLTSVGIELRVKNTYRQHQYIYKMLLDFQYPFNRPIIFYLKSDSVYAQCKDLLDILLEGSNWGPSLMLTYFLDKLQNISQIIRQNTPFQSKHLYHINENYRKEFLQQMSIKLFQVQEYTWKYLIKSTKKRIIGLNDQSLLIFQQSKQHKNNLTLQVYLPISWITTAKASVSGQNKKFNLQISYKQQPAITTSPKQDKLYFGGQSNIEQILGHLNPIEMIERKIAQLTKHPQQQVETLWQDNNQMVREFTQVIEYYSLKDVPKAERYINLMKEMIAKFYNVENKGEENQEYEMQKQEIQT